MFCPIICSMYRILTYKTRKFMGSLCSQVFHTWSIWVCFRGNKLVKPILIEIDTQATSGFTNVRTLQKKMNLKTLVVQYDTQRSRGH